MSSTNASQVSLPECPHSFDGSELLQKLEVEFQVGLEPGEVERRQQQFGLNRLEVKSPISPWRIFFRQFQDLMVAILMVAVVVALIAWKVEGGEGFPSDAFVILAIVIANAALGFFQEYSAERAIEELQRSTTTKAKALRQGKLINLEQEQLVPGDIVEVGEGDQIPADMVLLQSSHLMVNESLLTGESVAVDKRIGAVERDATIDARTCMLHAGSTVSGGEGRGIVVATGQNTALGAIATSLGTTISEGTPLERRLNRLGGQIGWGILALTIIIAGTVLLVEGNVQLSTLSRVAMFSVALAVAAVPEGLPAVLTISLSAGARRLSRRNAVARRMAAVETLGSVTTIVTDKTGTLTVNQMTVKKLACDGRVLQVEADDIKKNLSDSKGFRALLECGILANSAHLEDTPKGRQAVGDPMDAGLLLLAETAELDWESLRTEQPKVDDIPFSSDRARMSHLRHGQSGRVLYCKGSLQSVLSKCQFRFSDSGPVSLDEEYLQALHDRENEFAVKALRTLAFARRMEAPETADEAEEQLEFLGLAAFWDPPRAEVPEAIGLCRDAGIRVVMMTGDHPATAAAIAKQVALVDHEITPTTGREVSGFTPEKLKAVVREQNVFARVAPEQKLALVTQLIEDGQVVAMTGDGVNDAPALKKVHVGVAMGKSGTAVAVEASDIVLTDDNFTTIVAAVEEGRSVFANVQRFIAFLFSGNFGVVTAMFLGTLIAGFFDLRFEGEILLPLLAAQILWMNLVTDGPPAVAFALGKSTKELMKHPPRDPESPILTKQLWNLVFVTGLVLAAIFLFVLDVMYAGGFLTLQSSSPAFARSTAFYTLVTARLINSLNFLDIDHSLFRRSTWNNPWVPAASVLSWFLTLGILFWPPAATLFHLVPPDVAQISMITVLLFPAMLGPAEIYKWWRRKSG